VTHVPDHPRHVPTAPIDRPTSLPGNVIRGALIGVVETVPGVSGGTVALVTGIYRQLIDSASAVVSAIRVVVTGPDRVNSMWAYLSYVHWRVIIPVVIGMIIGLFTAVQFIGDWVETYPQLTRAAFFGMVLVSIAVPFRMAQRSAGGSLRPRHWALGAAAVVVTFVLVSLPPGVVQPHWWLVLPAAALAVSALLLPGLSGSFLLLTFGLYEPTISAARDLDLGYLGIFFAGAALGMVSIVKGLKWLLDHHHTVTMVVLAGVMLGALRTLWPWQTQDRGLLPPDQLLGPAVGIAAAGAAVVAVLVILDARLARAE
jgi:putative membrane protein